MSVLQLFPGEREFINCVRRLKDIGYGRMMQIISTEWYRVGGHGALTCGPCVGVVGEKAVKEAEYWLKNDPVFTDARQGRGEGET